MMVVFFCGNEIKNVNTSFGRKKLQGFLIRKKAPNRRRNCRALHGYRPNALVLLPLFLPEIETANECLRRVV